MAIRLDAAATEKQRTVVDVEYQDAFVHVIEITRGPPMKTGQERIIKIRVTFALGTEEADGSWSQLGKKVVEVEGQAAENFLRKNGLGAALEDELLKAAVQKGVLPAATVVDDF